MKKKVGRGLTSLTVGGLVFSGLVLVLGGITAFVTVQSSPAQAKDMVVYKSPDCECCNGWVSYLQRHGYHVTVVKLDDMDELKGKLGVSDDMRSCHTAKIGQYIVEGHVPAEAIDKLLAENPKVIGIAAPGMPSGAPGMDGPKETYTVYAFTPAGKSVFAEYQ